MGTVAFLHWREADIKDSEGNMVAFKTVICLFLAAIISRINSEGLKAGEESKFAKECVDAHNYVRSLHVNTPNVHWSDDIAAGAQAWAEHLAKIGKMEHEKNIGVGENVF